MHTKPLNMDASMRPASVNHGLAAECCVVAAACRQNNTPEMKMQWAQFNAAIMARKPHFPWLEVCHHAGRFECTQTGLQARGTAERC